MMNLLERIFANNKFCPNYSKNFTMHNMGGKFFTHPAYKLNRQTRRKIAGKLLSLQYQCAYIVDFYDEEMLKTQQISGLQDRFLELSDRSCDRSPIICYAKVTIDNLRRFTGNDRLSRFAGEIERVRRSILFPLNSGFTFHAVRLTFYRS